MPVGLAGEGGGVPDDGAALVAQRCLVVEAEGTVGDDEVAGGGDRKKFGQALNDTKDDGVAGGEAVGRDVGGGRAR